MSSKLYMHTYYLTHKDHLRKIKREYYLKHLDELKQRNKDHQEKAWYFKNKDKFKRLEKIYGGKK